MGTSSSAERPAAASWCRSRYTNTAFEIRPRPRRWRERRSWPYLFAGRVSRDFPAFFGCSTTASWGFSLLKNRKVPNMKYSHFPSGKSPVFLHVHSLQHGPYGEPWRKGGGEVFEGVDHQVDPAGETGNTLTRVLCSSEGDTRQHLGPLKSKRPFKEDQAAGKGGANQLAGAWRQTLTRSSPERSPALW